MSGFVLPLSYVHNRKCYWSAMMLYCF